MSEQKSYKDTLNLPKTSLNIRANAAQREPEIRVHWEKIGLCDAYFKAEGNQPFTLHDGPPYANGHLHVGHALNNVLKDIVVRSFRMMGRDVSFVPGWDCHGLPIELKVAATVGDLRMADPVAFKKACRKYVEQWKALQEEELKELGVCAEWSQRYLTMDPTYEASILQSLAQFVEKGYIERKGKTVPWCFSCQTVLANAEIEYAERKDPSCYIQFKAASVPEKVNALVAGRTLSFLIWTTTPWTIPLNRAVVLNPDALYAVVALDGKRAVVVGYDLWEKLKPILGEQASLIGSLPSADFIGLHAHHPLVQSLQVPVIGDAAVSTTDGTACLHSAPGCGPEDYLMGLKHGLEIYSPLSASGHYTKGIMPESLEGMAITDGQWWVLKHLQENGSLLHKTAIKHSYPHCWRCRNGLMFRATDQWFCDLNKNNLVQKAQQALDTITFVPSWGKSRLEAFLAHRTEWCISRQRSWGVPIPALYNKQTGASLLTPSLIRGVAEHVAQEGVEYWDRVTIAELRAEGMLPAELSLLADEDIIKEKDILDVWFDSGVSHFAVIAARGKTLPVDVYLEGSDQHRGWFQSALLSAMVLHDHAPMREIITHGFVMDGQGHKMSKSRGNVVDPKEVVKKHGADVLRLWVASVDYERDVVISDTLLTQTAETYRKIRNTARFLLANLYDFNPAIDSVEDADLLLLDRWALHEAFEILGRVKELYAAYAYASIVQLLARYCSVVLSAQYLDMSKDRLYVEQPDGLARRSAQTVQYKILAMLNQMIAPLIPFAAEDIYQALPYGDKEGSIHLTRFECTQKVVNVGTDALWHQLLALRDEVLLHSEQLRVAGTIKHSLEARVIIKGHAELMQLLSTHLGAQKPDAFLKEWFIVSQCTIEQETQDSSVLVAPAIGVKCPRCWHWFAAQADLCDRCLRVVQALH